ncbi:hypothetical protein COV24_00990 [candidate division WWE3 bacterium CG10_big_fil_rev_8_21_14_0_10_32_10]|uniref:Pyrrolo-quinoline quinone repeat domain-containing protein n=1 Tax=candidate division WWE3 bacterium CG10_big_fil_rev_8_21_14_0_10_32_10 TaxID=1975090 RepID=A0A2H0RBF9_UNCKA|nr:MAG: hypothetical protein COV24_00990 [candidate division WWE3 bacterium CG10_big_fil_rev_8_21_14_0_10_32_10]
MFEKAKLYIKISSLLFLFTLVVLAIQIRLTRDNNSTIQKSIEVNQVQAQNTTYDWPQYRHDENRTGYNPTGPVANAQGEYYFSEQWSKQFTGEGLSFTAEPIIVGNVVYMGTKTGKVYAFTLANGNELWNKQIEGGITHSLAATPSTVFAATLAGNVYALDSSNGTIQWTFTTEGSFGSAPLLVTNKNRLYVVNETGKIHAIDITDGNEIWNTPLDTFILQSPTYGNNQIFVGVEDMKLYALNADTGAINWNSSLLYGMTFHNYAPLYMNGKIWVNTTEDTYTVSQGSGGNDTLMKQANYDTWKYTQDPSYTLSQAQDATVQWLQTYPKAQTTYAFHEDGSTSYIPGLFEVVTNGGAQPPGVFDGTNLYTAYHVTSPKWLRLVWGSELQAAGYPHNADIGVFGTFDIATGRAISFSYYTPGEFTVDETNNYSGTGNVFFGARCGSQASCSTLQGNRCQINKQTQFIFTGDTCKPGSAPVYANGYIAHQTWNLLTVYK